MTQVNKNCQQCIDNRIWYWKSKIQIFIVGGWSVAVSERDHHGNRLRVSVSYDLDQDTVLLPIHEVSEIDDCRGDTYVELLIWLKNHPISKDNVYEKWDFEDISGSIFPNTNSQQYFNVRPIVIESAISN